jgi:hypothetical protein
VDERVVHSKSFSILPVPVELILSKEDEDVKSVFIRYATEKVKLEVTCINQRASIIEDVRTFISESFVSLAHLGLGQGFKSPKCGLGLRY